MPRISELSAEGNGRVNNGWYDVTIARAEVMTTASGVLKDDRGNAQLQFRFRLETGASVSRSRVSATLLPNQKGEASIMASIAAAALNLPLTSPELDCDLEQLVNKRLRIRVQNNGNGYSDVVEYAPAANSGGNGETQPAPAAAANAAAAAPAGETQVVRRRDRANLAAVPPTAMREALAKLNDVVAQLDLTPKEIKVVADDLFPSLAKSEYRLAEIEALREGLICKYAEPIAEAVNN